jgi:hypothetical protein
MELRLRIRATDSWPQKKQATEEHRKTGHGRTQKNTEKH